MPNINGLETITEKGKKSSNKLVKLFTLVERHYQRPDESYYTRRSFSHENIYGPFANTSALKKELNSLKKGLENKGYDESMNNYMISGEHSIDYETEELKISKKNIVKKNGKLFVQHLNDNLKENSKEILF